MDVVSALVARNLRLFYRDRVNVFFALLAAIILFALYTLFLGELQISGLRESFPAATRGQIKAFIDSWMFAGIVSMTAITTGLGAFGVLVEDAATGRFRDFLVAPVGRGQLVLGYLLAALAVALTMTLILLAGSLVYLYALNGIRLPAGAVLRVAGYIALTGAAFAAISAFVTSFVRTPGAYAALCTIVGTVLGFLTGAYIPVGSFPDGVRAIVSALPFAQASMLMRDEFATGTLEAVVGDAPAARADLRTYYGMDVTIGDRPITAGYVIAALAVITFVFAALAAMRIRARIGRR